MKKFYKVYHNPALGYNVIDKMQPIEMQPVHPRVMSYDSLITAHDAFFALVKLHEKKPITCLNN